MLVKSSDTRASFSGAPMRTLPHTISWGAGRRELIRVEEKTGVSTFSATKAVRLELNGQDITVIARNVRTEEEIGQRRTAEFDLTYEDGVVFDQSSADDFLLANSAPFLLADGAHFKLASGGGDPENYMPVVISHPDRTFRDVALGLGPWLYWPLDEGRGLATADDITLPERTQEDPSAANRDGTWSTTPGAVILRRLEAERAAVPYGAAPRFEAGAAPGITGPPTTGLGIEVAVSLFVRIDVGATGSSSVLTARSGGNGMDIVRERVSATSQRVTWRVNERYRRGRHPVGPVGLDGVSTNLLVRPNDPGGRPVIPKYTTRFYSAHRRCGGNR